MESTPVAEDNLSSFLAFASFELFESLDLARVPGYGKGVGIKVGHELSYAILDLTCRPTDVYSGIARGNTSVSSFVLLRSHVQQVIVCIDQRCQRLSQVSACDLLANDDVLKSDRELEILEEVFLLDASKGHLSGEIFGSGISWQPAGHAFTDEHPFTLGLVVLSKVCVHSSCRCHWARNVADIEVEQICPV